MGAHSKKYFFEVAGYLLCCVIRVIVKCVISFTTGSEVSVFPIPSDTTNEEI